MHSPTAGHVTDLQVRFRECVVDRVRHELRRRGELVEVQPLVFALLNYFIDNAGRVVTKDELLQTVWRSPIVTDTVVARAVMKLRRAIGDVGEGRPLLVTLHGVGYRFDAKVESANVDALSADAPTAPPDIAPHSGALAILSIPASSGGSADGAVHQGLALWLHYLFTRENFGALLPMTSVLSWRPDPLHGFDLQAACRALGAGQALNCEYVQEGQAHVLLATWGRDATTLRNGRFEGGDLEDAALQLIDAMRGVTTPHASTGSRFWHDQCLRSFSLESQGLEQQALALLEACLPHIRSSPALSLVHVRLLRKRLQLARAKHVAETALNSLARDQAAAVRIGLVLELVEISGLMRDMKDYFARCDEAMDLLISGGVPDVMRHEVLMLAARLAGERGDHDHGAKLAVRALEIAQTNGDYAGSIQARILAATLALGGERSEEAAHQLRLATTQAAEARMPRLECSAYVALSSVSSEKRQLDVAVDCALRASVLASDSGDLRMRSRARARAVTALTEAGRLEEAYAFMDQSDAASGEVIGTSTALHGWNRARLAWRNGRRDEALRELSSLLRALESRRTPMRWTVAAELVRYLLATGRRAEAEAVLHSHGDDPQKPRRDGCLAALQIFDGQRQLCRATLLSAWERRVASTPTEQDNALELAWLLAEDRDSAALEPLWDYVASIPSSYAPARMVQYIRKVFSGNHSADPREWLEACQGASGLALRHARVLHPDFPGRMLMGTEPPLSELLVQACW